ncbi:c-type cytochrome [Methylococcus capsulatus]|jgi:cytochrome c553|nr:c-type cytochrome [Methylococcus capsulatus]QXP91626.1 c-type cytochrome [Methylococcus capsulatus]
MKAILLVATGMMFVAGVDAAPSTQVAWTPATLDFVEKGDAGRGKALSAPCAGCHDGTGTNPSLSGQLPTYLYRQLQDYKNGNRQDPTTIMNTMASALRDQDMADLAAWYGQQAPMRGAGGASDATGIAGRGEGRRMEPPCSSCHGGAGQGEKVDTPRLAGQSAAYLEATLLAYKSGQRANDIYSRMRLIAAKLSDAEIRQLADYYSRLK